ncbi:L,D-transpeptidase [Microbacterium sp. X-17]|uniref:L,D-transpeptidase n=1 Tax=Microbacterium sp. X-17 TaxID=3144404 RepID=UPI0031F484D5
MAPRPRLGRRTLVILTIVVGALLVAGFVALALRTLLPGTPAGAPTDTMPTIHVTPSPSPTRAGPPANTKGYDLAGLPAVDVFAVIPALPVDADPTAPTTGLVATPAAAVVPVFADPTADPVATLASHQTYDGTTVPVVEKYADWVKVLLVGRETVPSNGQVAGWIRMADVTLSPLDTHVEVSLSARTIDLVSASGSERIATDFGWGTPQTPTPVGRAFVMMTRTAPELGYTRGHPLVYLSTQSEALGDFGGAAVAVTAFHYHDEHSGDVSNGCLRVSADVIDRLAPLPEGTVVEIRP